MITDQMIWDAATELGLSPWETEWLVVPAHVMYDVGTRGLPGRFSHWTHGKAYWRQRLDFDAGRSRIYELVLPTRPALALLLDGNSEIEHLLVKAHVLAHVDFFKHNRYFAQNDERAHEAASRRAERVRRYESRYGMERVEQVLTAALAVSQGTHPGGWSGWEVDPEPEEPTDPYADLRSLTLHSGATAPKLEEPAPVRKRRLRPTTDILAFLIEYWPHLEDFERDLLSIVREESLYFWPIRQTKIINEGWASFWHQEIMRSLPLTLQEAVDFAKLHSSVTSAYPIGINPYHLGLVIWRSIEKRFGRERMFKLRSEAGDLDFIRNYLDQETIEQEGLFLSEVDYKRELVVTAAEDWEMVRDGICNQIAGQQPDVFVVDVDSPEAPSLLRLHHNYWGKTLVQEDLKQVMLSLTYLLRTKVCLTTVVDGRVTEFTAVRKDVSSVPKESLSKEVYIWPGT